MRIEVLFFEGCPNHGPTVQLLRDVTAAQGVGADLAEVEVRSPEEAARLRFLGSPTVLVDGVDAEPAAHADRGIGLCCRIYSDGTGVPPRELLEAAISRAGRESFEKL